MTEIKKTLLFKQGFRWFSFTQLLTLKFGHAKYLFFQTEVLQKLISALLIRFKLSGIEGGYRRTICIVYTSRTDTHVVSIHDHCYIVGTQDFSELVANLHGQALLDLWPFGKVLNDAVDFG